MNKSKRNKAIKAIIASSGNRPLGRNTIDASDLPAITKERLERDSPIEFKNDGTDYEVIDMEGIADESDPENDTMTISKYKHNRFLDTGNTIFVTVPANDLEINQCWHGCNRNTVKAYEKD